MRCVTHRADLLADVTISIGYRDDEYDVDAIVGEILREHGRVHISNLDPDAYRELIDRHRR